MKEIVVSGLPASRFEMSSIERVLAAWWSNRRGHEFAGMKRGAD